MTVCWLRWSEYIVTVNDLDHVKYFSVQALILMAMFSDTSQSPHDNNICSWDVHNNYVCANTHMVRTHIHTQRHRHTIMEQQHCYFIAEASTLLLYWWGTTAIQVVTHSQGGGGCYTMDITPTWFSDMKQHRLHQQGRVNTWNLAVVSI